MLVACADGLSSAGRLHGEHKIVDMNAFALRPGAEGDRDAIAALWHASASLPGVGPALMPTQREMLERVDLELAGGWDVTVAAVGGRLIGFIALKPKEAVLDQLFVHPGSLGFGVGRALLAHAIRTMPCGFTLFTRSANGKAMRFYEREGLVRIGEGGHPKTGDPITHYAWKVR